MPAGFSRPPSLFCGAGHNFKPTLSNMSASSRSVFRGLLRNGSKRGKHVRLPPLGGKKPKHQSPLATNNAKFLLADSIASRSCEGACKKKETENKSRRSKRDPNLSSSP